MGTLKLMYILFIDIWLHKEIDGKSHLIDLEISYKLNLIYSIYRLHKDTNQKFDPIDLEINYKFEVQF